MAFAMKVAQGAVPIEKCPYMSEDALATLSEATAPLMKTLEVGTGDNAHKLGGETVLFRHEKTLVNKNLFAGLLCSKKTDEEIDAKIADFEKVDYERIGEREYVELLYLHYAGNGADKYTALVEKAVKANRALVLDCGDAEVAKAALAICKDLKPILNGANKDNLDAMNAVATEAGVVLGVTGENLSEIYDTVKALEGKGNKKLIIDVTGKTIKETYANAVLVRRTNLKDGDRLARLSVHRQRGQARRGRSAHGDRAGGGVHAQVWLHPRHGQDGLCRGARAVRPAPEHLHRPAEADEGRAGHLSAQRRGRELALLADRRLRADLLPGLGEYERSKCPVNLLISDASGMSVLTAWAAGKFSAGTIKKFFDEYDIENKVKSRTLIIPGKVAVMKGEIEAKLPNWKVVVGPMEAVQLVKFIRDFEG